MRADWETAFENCPPYGEGKGAYTQEDFKCMMEMERNMEALLHWLESEGSFFLADLMGMEVRDAASGAVLGQIADILTLPANNVYVVRGGARELMIPAVDQFIAEVNVDEGYLRVNMMEGL